MILCKIHTKGPFKYFLKLGVQDADLSQDSGSAFLTSSKVNKNKSIYHC